LPDSLPAADDHPRKPTDEGDLIFDIDLRMIDQYKKKGTSNWVPINRAAITEEF
jgi:hypothetical protein